MERLMSICLTLLMVLTSVAGPAFAYDESSMLPADTQTETAQEDAFVVGYVSIEKGTTAYADPEGKEEAGLFASDSITYAEKCTDEDWYQVFFDTEESIEKDEGYVSVYVKSEDCAPLTAEDLAAQVEVFEKAENKYENRSLTFVDFEEVSKKDQPAEETEKAGKDVQAKAAVTITGQPASVTKTAGQSATFKVTASGSGLTYQWQSKAAGATAWGNTGMTGNKTATLTVNATLGLSGAQFRCVVRDQNGNSATSNAATLTVVEGLSLDSNPASVTKAAGQSATFKVTASGSGLTYQWQSKAAGATAWGNTGMTGNKTATLTVNATMGLNGAQFRCVVKDQYGNSITSKAATLTVVEGVKITSQPASVTKTAGQSAAFTVTATGTGLTYQWQSKGAGSSAWGNTGMTGNKTATLTVNATAGLNGAQFRCVVKDQYGNTATSNAATLTVVEGVKITGQPANVSKTAGQSAAFSVTATGTGLTYQWQSKAAGATTWGNTGMTGNKTATLTVSATMSLNGAQFRCVVKDQYGNTATSNAATLTVQTAINITSQPAAVTTSAGSSAVFKVTASGTGLTYQWQSKAPSATTWGNTGMTGNKTNTLTVNATKGLDGVQFRCVVKDQYGSTVASNAAKLTVVDGPAISTQPASVTKTVGETATFKIAATGTGIIYQWQSKAPGATTWGNTGMTGNKTNTLTVNSTMGLNGVQFRCVVTDKYGASVASGAATLNVVSKIDITSHPSSVTTSAGMTATFRVAASGSGLTYQWQSRASGGSWGNTGMTGNKTNTLSVTATMGLNGVQFRCVITDQYGTKVTSNAATLTVAERPAISSNPASVTKTEGQTATFKVVASGTGITYQWQSKAAGATAWGNTGMTGNKTATLTVNATLGLNGVQFRCVVTDKYGNSAISNAATLTVVAAPKITSHPVNVTKVEGQTAEFTVSATGTGLTYQWQSKAAGATAWGNTGMTGNKTATLTVNATLGLNGVQFRCVVKDQFGNTVTSNAATLTVVKALVISSHPESVTKTEGETATFKVVASGTGLSYQWQSKASGGSWGNTSMTGSTTATLTVTASMSLNGAQFRCVVSDQYGNSLTSNAATLTVKKAPKYRALLISEVNFSGDTCTRNQGDVDLMTDMLESVHGPSGGSYSITTAMDSSPGEILSLISSTFKGATSDDVSLFFIATHGYVDFDTGRIAGGLATVRETEDRYLDGGDGYYYHCEDCILFDEIAGALSNIPGKAIVIIESCGSGAAIYDPGISENNKAAGDADFDDAEFTQKAIDAFAAYDKKNPDGISPKTGELRVENKFYVLTASRHMELSWGSEYYGYNYFTKWLTDGVGTGGSIPADYQYGDGDGYVELEELFNYISAVGDDYDFYDGYDYYYQHVQRYPKYSDYELFKR